MNEQTMQTVLNAMISDAILAADEGDEEIMVPEEAAEIELVSTFEEAGVLTTNKGLVVRMKDRREFQITIVQSR